MLVIPKEYSDNLFKSLFNIISRYSDIDISTTDEIEFELFDVRFGQTFIVFIDGKKYHIYSLTSIEEAKYVYDNINKIEYLYCCEDNWDSIVGDIHDFIANKYGFAPYSFEHICAIHRYKTYVEKTNDLPTLSKFRP